jgi:hypothetical protein
MNRLIALACVLVVPLVAGCSSTSAGNERGQKMTLVSPADQTLKRGEVNRVAVTVLRENLIDNVKVSFEDLPDGVNVIEKDREMNHDDLVVIYTLHAENDADLVKNHEVKVRAEAPDGLAVTESFTVSVVDR